ncbi:MAG: SHOCT domain-containing protein [Spirochaetia bacterium]|nr:SHOCT domain-containing protein [Spirochaetia bacterium]
MNIFFRAVRGFALPVVFILPILMAGCSSAFVSMEQVFADSNLALFRIPADAYPTAPDLKNVVGQPADMPALSPEKVIDLLGNLRFLRMTLWSKTERRIFLDEELRWIAPKIARTLPTVGKNRLVIVSRFDPDRSVLSRMERVTLLMWADSEGINVVFGELRQEIPHNDFLEYDRWTDILPISLRRAYPDLTVLPSEGYQLKIVNGQEHTTWVVIKPSDLENIHYQKEQAKPDTKNERQAERTADKKEPPLSDKLRDLKKAKDEGLMTDEEYEKTRQKIIDAAH